MHRDDRTALGQKNVLQFEPALKGAVACGVVAPAAEITFFALNGFGPLPRLVRIERKVMVRLLRSRVRCGGAASCMAWRCTHSRPRYFSRLPLPCLSPRTKARAR